MKKQVEELEKELQTECQRRQEDVASLQQEISSLRALLQERDRDRGKNSDSTASPPKSHHREENRKLRRPEEKTSQASFHNQVVDIQAHEISTFSVS